MLFYVFLSSLEDMFNVIEDILFVGRVFEFFKGKLDYFVKLFIFIVLKFFV